MSDRTSITRRTLFTGATLASVVIASDLTLSRPPEQVIVCWSGWRNSPTNTGTMAWYTDHLPVFAHAPGADPNRESRQHFVSFVQRKYPNAYGPDGPEPRVQGYWPGDDFMILNQVQMEDSEDALRSWRTEGWEATLDRVFAENKRAAQDALVAYVSKLIITEPANV